jgi:hypothetical protein
MKKLFYKQIPFLLALTLTLALASGCSTTRHIRSAQDSWSRASTIENTLFAEGRSIVGGQLEQVEAATEYRLALAQLNQELKENADKLKADKLYGTALMLKAKCLWRLADLDHVVAPSIASETTSSLVEVAMTSGFNKASTPSIELALTIAQIKSNWETITLGQRDAIMLTALPGMRDHDRGLVATDLATAEKFFSSAITVLDTAIEEEQKLLAGANTELLQTYLKIAQLSTYRAWKSALFHYLEKQNLTPIQMAQHPGTIEVNSKATKLVKNLTAVANATGDKSLETLITLFKTRLGI